MEQITLYYREGASDKVYQATIGQNHDGYIVTFAFGRRGSTLQTGTKTPTAVNYEAAKAIYDKLVKEKKAKGYTPGEDGTPYQQTDKANQDTGIRCQLLNPVTEDQIPALTQDPMIWCQKKHDGRRMLIEKTADTVIGINRQGLKVALPKTLEDDAKACPLMYIIDGEAVGEILYAFDLLMLDGHDTRTMPYMERHLRLMNLLASFQHPYIQLVATACTTEEKQRMLDSLKARNAEGIVFKRINHPYTTGRPASGGPALKFKFHETASFIVSKVNAKRSVSLELINGTGRKPAGNVTIPPNHDIPAVGAIIEARYLYAYPESSHIYQPVYLGLRDDIPHEECTVDQLKFKNGANQTEQKAYPPGSLK